MFWEELLKGYQEVDNRLFQMIQGAEDPDALEKYVSESSAVSLLVYPDKMNRILDAWEAERSC